MTRRRPVPPGLRKARDLEKEDRRARRRAIPSQEMREEIDVAFSPPEQKAWSGKNDGTPGCLRTRRALRSVIYVDPGGCPWCRCTRFRRLSPDENYPDGRAVCLACHPEGRSA